MNLLFLRSRKFKLQTSSKSSKQTEIRQAETKTTTVCKQEQQEPKCKAELEENDDSIPKTEADARKHIAKIRAEKGLDGTDSNTADLQAALMV
jgi:hypothetical protein